MLVHAPGPPKDQKDQPSSHQTPSVPCVWVALGRPGDGQMSQERIVESFPRNWNSQNEYARTWHTRFGVLSPRPAAPEGSQRQPGGLEVAEWAVLIIKEPRLKFTSTGHT